MTTPSIHHDGSPCSEREHFYREAPPSIGEVRSAQTTDRDGPKSPLAAFLRASECSYVGSSGVSRHRRHFSRTRDEQLVFAPNVELRVARDAKLKGRLMHTRVLYEFRDVSGAPLFAIRASVTQGLTPSTEDPIHFGEAAERAYSEYVLRSYDAELKEHGFVRVALNAHESVCIGPAFIEIRAGGKTARLDATVLQAVVVNRGALEIRSEGAGTKEMPAQSIFRIRIDPGHSVHALAVLLQELVGFRMG